MHESDLTAIETRAEFIEGYRKVNDLSRLIAEFRKLRAAVREIIDDASPCTTACHVIVAERLIKEAEELLDR
jgi:hypothetical protein